VITPRLFRRALRGALQPRFLGLWACGSLLPAALAALPMLRVFSRLFDRAPHAREMVSRLDAGVLTDVLRQLAEDAPALQGGATAAVVMALLVAPALAGAALVLGREQGPSRMRALLCGMGEHYGRLFRLALFGLVPLGVAAVLSGAALRGARNAALRAATETQAVRGGRAALVAAVVLFFLAQLTLDAGRAAFAAQPHRRSAVLAWWSGVRLVVRQPLRAVGLGLITLVAGAGAASIFLVLRLRIPQSGPWTVALAFLLAELAAAAIGWHRAARLIGFADLGRADLAERECRGAEAAVRPQDGSLSPPPPSGTQPPLATPR
jgi:hypothetical protein